MTRRWHDGRGSPQYKAQILSHMRGGRGHVIARLALRYLWAPFESRHLLRPTQAAQFPGPVVQTRRPLRRLCCLSPAEIPLQVLSPLTPHGVRLPFSASRPIEAGSYSLLSPPFPDLGRLIPQVFHSCIRTSYCQSSRDIRVQARNPGALVTKS